MKFLSVRLLLGSVVLIVFTSTACSPQATVNSYSYLLKDRQKSEPRLSPSVNPEIKTQEISIAVTAPVTPEDPAPMSSPSVSRPVQTGSLHTFKPRPDRRQLRQQEIIINTAKSYIGTPYRYGGMSRLGVDCSGLICLAYRAGNQSLPRTSKAMSESGTAVSKEQLQPGHLIFFDAKNGQNINHVGMVVATSQGATEFIHATSSAGVRIDRLEDPYWNIRYRKAVSP